MYICRLDVQVAYAAPVSDDNSSDAAGDDDNPDHYQHTPTQYLASQAIEQAQLEPNQEDVDALDWQPTPITPPRPTRFSATEPRLLDIANLPSTRFPSTVKPTSSRDPSVKTKARPERIPSQPECQGISVTSPAGPATIGDPVRARSVQPQGRAQGRRRLAPEVRRSAISVVKSLS